jgi:hypothetical protein
MAGGSTGSAGVAEAEGEDGATGDTGVAGIAPGFVPCGVTPPGACCTSGLAPGRDAVVPGRVGRAVVPGTVSRAGSGLFLVAAVLGGAGGRTRIKGGLLIGAWTGSGACGIV